MKIARMKTYIFRLSRSVPLLGLAACLSVAASAADHGPERSGSGASAPAPVPVTITWAMTERFGPGYDRNRDGRPDLPNSHEYVNPGRYEVRLAACVDGASVAAEGLSCNWTINGFDPAIELRATGPRPVVRLPQGTFSVSVNVQLADGRAGSARDTIRVKDILIIVLGDSLVSGEGNPEEPACWEGAGTSAGGGVLRGRLDPPTPARWADGGPDGHQPRVTPAGILLPANVLHSVAHRSTRSSLAQVAMRLEAEDPHTSVTFVCLAATGARIDDLFISDRSARCKARGTGPALPAQLDELHAIAGSRPVDILLLSVGLNDARAFELLGELMRKEIRCVNPRRLLAVYPTRRDWTAAASPDIEALVDPTKRSWLDGLEADARRTILLKETGVIFDLAEMAAAGLATARDQLERLARAIAKDKLLAQAEIYLMEYPDPTGAASGATAPTILNELVPGLQVNGRELALARERLLCPLMMMLHDVADSQGWTCVDGIFASFESHGYEATDTWFVKAKESEQLQGPRLTPVGYLCGGFAPGMLHPNRRGHQVIADRLYRRLAAGRTTHPGQEVRNVPEITSGVGEEDAARRRLSGSSAGPTTSNDVGPRSLIQ
jgi:hypothetical protein